MRRIVKGEPCEEFKEFLKSNNDNNWGDPKFSLIRPEIRRYILEKEQSNLCAYTEKRIDDSNKGCHIDHFKKRDHFPDLTFDWNNLLVSCDDKDYGAKYKDKNEGDKTLKEKDYDDIINPTEEDPNEYFIYDTLGEIIAKDTRSKDKAERTIECFNLNHHALKECRKRHIDILINYSKGGFSKEDIINLIEKDRFPFPSCLNYILEVYWEFIENSQSLN